VTTEQEELAARQAMQMLEVLYSVGATSFDLYLLDPNNDMVPKSRRNGRTIDHCHRCIREALRYAAGRNYSLTVLPQCEPGRIVRLDDVTDPAPYEPVACLITRTSTNPDKFHVFLAITDGDREFRRRVWAAAKCDPNAHGGSRLAGTYNTKKKYAPDFPLVVIVQAFLDWTTTKSELIGHNLAAAADLSAPPTSGGCGSLTGTTGERYARQTARKAIASWGTTPPRCKGQWEVCYGECLAKAPLKADGTGPDRHLADWSFARQLAFQGVSEDEITAELMRVSDKAKRR